MGAEPHYQEGKTSRLRAFTSIIFEQGIIQGMIGRSTFTMRRRGGD